MADYSPVLRDVGFAVTTYEETPDWKRWLEGAYSAVVAAKDRLALQMGEQAVEAMLFEMTLTLEVQPYRRRVFAAATKPT